MTNDGISKDDWDEVIDLSAKIANAISSDDEALSNLLSTRLLRVLDALERKYGRLPAILATRADCIDDSREKIVLFEEAWRLAGDRGDRFNLVLIASSLSELYIEELKNLSSGKQWLTRLEEALENHWDDGEYHELQRLRKLASPDNV